jgi:hypothetical protein
MQVFTDQNKFFTFVVSMYPDTKPVSISTTPLNASILKLYNEFDQRQLLIVTNVLYKLCKKSLNPDFLLATLGTFFNKKNSYYYLWIERDEILAFSFIFKESKKDYLQNIGANELKSELMKINSELPLLIKVLEKSGASSQIFSISVFCFCNEEKGRKLFKNIEDSIYGNHSIVTIENPLKKNKSFYESVGFVYEADLVDWSGTIYKITQK